MSFYDRLLNETRGAREQLLALPIIRATLNGEVTLPRYLAFLEQAYHHVSHTVPLMMACGSRLNREQQWLQAPLIEYVNEEQGHEQWILADIAAAGGDPAKTLAAGPALETEVMVAWAYHNIDRGNSLSFLGMVHVLEGTSTALATQAADRIQTRLGLPDTAMRYLRSHGELDQSHVRFFEQLVNHISDRRDQDAVIHAARTHYRLYGAILARLEGEHHEL